MGETTCRQSGHSVNVRACTVASIHFVNMDQGYYDIDSILADSQVRTLDAQLEPLADVVHRNCLVRSSCQFQDWAF